MNLLWRLARDYLRIHVGKLSLVLMAALVSSVSPFTLSYLNKIMVDDVLQIGGGSEKSQGSGLVPRREQRSGAAESAPARVREGGSSAPGDNARAAGWLKSRRLRLLWMIFCGYVGLRLFFAGLSWVYTYGIARIGQEIIYRLRQDVYGKLQSLQVSYFDRLQTGKIMARVMDDVNAVQSSISSVFIKFFADVATLIVGAGILFQIDSRLAALALATLPFYVVVYQFFVLRIRSVNRALRERNAALYGSIGDSVSGARVVMSFARELREYRRFYGVLADYLRLQWKNSVLNTGLSVLCGLISGLGTTLVVYYGLLSIQSGRMSLGEFLYFYGSIGHLFSPIVSISNMNISLQGVLTALNRVFDVMDEEVTIYDPENAIQMDTIHGEIVFHNVSLKYDEKGDYALRRVNFGVFPGQVVCVVGASGAGKTSLVNMLLRMYAPTEGRITVDGEDIQHIAMSSLRRHIRMVPQEPILFSGTLAENIRYGFPDAPPEAVIRAAQAAELHEFILSLPAKYETQIGEGGVSLSGGQKQRMAMAMTLITDPSVLILDDSTSALDAKTEARIHRTLERIMEGRTAFVITQKVMMARKADLVLVLDKGRVVECGTHDLLVAQRGAYYSLFQTQLGEDEAQGRTVVETAAGGE